MDKAREARRSSEETNVKIGIMLNSQFAPGTHTAAAFRETVEQVRLMRELGFDSVWVGQHYLGGGFALALASDVRFAAPSARMNVAMVRMGLTGCDVGISYFLPRAVGASVASELMMSGRFIDAERALRVGLVSDVVAEDALEPTARALAQEMLRASPLGLRLTKEGLNLALGGGSLETAIALEDRGQILCASAGFFVEGIAAFRERRAASFPDE
ncbi:MAG: LLM class flavin-dependent oxidoreductase [Candidatus Rokubacteria bacterium]|nr:LLM class flavin-dependent oxidoreductase [Candidatus Rokubacteria bacterium]